jgi:hypothetical protein
MKMKMNTLVVIAFFAFALPLKSYSAFPAKTQCLSFKQHDAAAPDSATRRHQQKADNMFSIVALASGIAAYPSVLFVLLQQTYLSLLIPFSLAAVAFIFGIKGMKGHGHLRGLAIAGFVLSLFIIVPIVTALIAALIT